MRYINKFTGAEVTLTRKFRSDGKNAMDYVCYTKDYPTPPEKGRSGEMTALGPTEVVKPYYVFERCYIRI